MSLVLLAGMLLLSGSYVFAIPVTDSRYRAVSEEENQAINLNKLRDLNNSFLLWRFAVLAKDNLHDAIRDLEAAEQHKNDQRGISNISPADLREFLYGSNSDVGSDKLLATRNRKPDKKRNNFSDCFWKYCV